MFHVSVISHDLGCPQEVEEEELGHVTLVCDGLAVGEEVDQHFWMVDRVVAEDQVVQEVIHGGAQQGDCPAW